MYRTRSCRERIRILKYQIELTGREHDTLRKIIGAIAGNELGETRLFEHSKLEPLEETTMVEKSNFSESQYHADCQTAYDSGYITGLLDAENATVCFSSTPESETLSIREKVRRWKEAQELANQIEISSMVAFKKDGTKGIVLSIDDFDNDEQVTVFDENCLVRTVRLDQLCFIGDTNCVTDVLNKLKGEDD